jgi:hypothetical protein
MLGHGAALVNWSDEVEEQDVRRTLAAMRHVTTTTRFFMISLQDGKVKAFAAKQHLQQ